MEPTYETVRQVRQALTMAEHQLEQIVHHPQPVSNYELARAGIQWEIDRLRQELSDRP